MVNPPSNGQWSKWYYDFLTDPSDLYTELYKTSVTNFDQYGNLIGEADYPYATNGSPTAFHGLSMSYNSSLCSSKNICDHPSSVQVNDAQGHQYALTNYSSYDSNGNLKEVDRWVAGSTYLSTYYNYNGNGTLASIQDPNAATTTYTYGSGGCNGAFPTSVSVAGVLTTSYQYNCTGGVVTAVTDPNGAVTTTTYTDPDFGNRRARRMH